MTKVRCVVDANDVLGETPLWCEASQALWWLDIDGCKVQRYEPISGNYRSFSFDARFVGSLALRENGGLLVALDLTLHTFDPVTGQW
jgi:sugar lactone lactonase YvrE